MDCHYNYSQTLCIELLNFNISYPDLMQFHYFVDNTDLRLKEGFGGETRPKDRVKAGLTLWVSVLAHGFPTFSFVF